MSLREGDKIEVTGQCIPEMEPGIYWVAFIDVIHGSRCYAFRKFYGRRIHVKHWVNLVDSFLGTHIQKAA